MSYTNNPTLSSAGEYKQFVVSAPIVSTELTPEQRILKFAENGNAEGIRKMAENPKFATNNRIKSEIIDYEYIDSEDELVWTPIMRAIKGGHAECIVALYEAGADTNKRSLHSVFSDVEYELNSLMYASLLVAKKKIGIECVEALLKRRRAQEQTERNYIVDVTERGHHIKASALTFVIHMANQQLLPVHLPLIKLLLDNRVNIRDDDFVQFNIQRPEVLKLLLGRLRYDTLYVITDLDDVPFLPNLITLKWCDEYKPYDSEKRRESARLLLDFYTSEELVKRREELGAEPEKEEAAPALFWHAIKYKVPEVVEQCIEENIPFYNKPIDIYGSDVGTLGWDILRKVLAYREQRGENIKLSSKLIAIITHDKDFLLKEDLDVDVLTGFGVHHNICAWGNNGERGHRYQYEIARVLPRNLDFAIKHGFDPYRRWGHILVRVHNQTEFTKAFVFMKTTPIIIDLGGGEYRLPKTNIDVSGVYEDINNINDTGRIQNGRVIDADGNVPSKEAWAEHFKHGVQISEGTLPFKKGDIITIQHNEGKMTGQLEKEPKAGWYSLVGYEKAFQAKKENVSFCDIPAAHVIMNANILDLNFLLLENEDIDELDFEDDYWSVQTAETLGKITWGYSKVESFIAYLLTHSWNLSDPYKDGDVFKIFDRFVQKGAFVSEEFCQQLLNNAAGFPIQDAISIYDLLRVNCPGYKFGEDEQHEFADFANFAHDRNYPTAEYLRDSIQERLVLFEHILEVENSGEETYFPIFPIYIRKICEIVSRGKVYEPDAYLAKFLIKVHAKDVSSEIVIKCVEQMLAAGFDINYNQHVDVRIPLFYVLDNGNELVLDVFLKHPDLDINQNVKADIELTALESLMLNINDRDTARIMIDKMLQDDRVECPFRQHILSPYQVAEEAPEIVGFLLRRKYFDGPKDKPREWYFDPNTVPGTSVLRHIWKHQLEDQGIEPLTWNDTDDEYTDDEYVKKLRTNMQAAVRVLHWRGLALQHLPWRLRKKSPVVREAVQTNGLALQFVTVRHMMSWDIVQSAVIQNWRAYQFLPQKAIYERTKEPVSFEDRKDVQKILVYGEELNKYIHEMFKDFSEGHVYEIEDVIDNIRDVSEGEDLDALVQKILVVMGKIHDEWVSEPYEYRGLPSQSEPGFVIWMRHLFGKNGPHEGEWPEFKEMFPEAAAYAEMNPDTHEGQKEIEEEKSDVRKQKEKKTIEKLRDAVHAQLGKEVDIVHWDDFEPIMFS